MTVKERSFDKWHGAYYGLPGQRFRVRPYAVEADGKSGKCFAWTFWGNERVRWYWVRHEDGKEKAYSLSQVKRITGPTSVATGTAPPTSNQEREPE